MIIPDEAVQAALSTWPPTCTPYVPAVQMRLALSAALPLLQTAKVEDCRMAVISENKIINAIDYALRCEAVTEVTPSEDGEYEVEIHEASSLRPFVMCLLRELGVSA